MFVKCTTAVAHLRVVYSSNDSTVSGLSLPSLQPMSRPCDPTLPLTALAFKVVHDKQKGNSAGL